MAAHTAFGTATVFGAMIILASATRAGACGGFAEAPVACDDPSPNGFASWMLGRADKAIKADKAKALADLNAGTNGFRTADTYVLCVAPDGVMSAHPNPILRDHDVRDLHDRTGNYFINAMMENAKAGEVKEIRYLFPKPGSTVEEAKTTYYTRAGDQMCGVGVYDATTTATQQVTPEGRVAALRAKLDGQIPASARADWNAFLEALTQADDAQAAVVARARDSLKAAEDALAPPNRQQRFNEAWPILIVGAAHTRYSAPLPAGEPEAFATPYGDAAGEHAATGRRGPVPRASP